MPEDAPTCAGCGARGEGWICRHCGRRLRPAADAESERAALDALHQALATKDDDAQARLLQHAFLPDDPRTLVEAGARCLPILTTEGVALARDAAASRLDAIVAKLRVLGEPEEATRAAALYAEQVAAYRKEQDRYGFWGCLSFALVGALACGLLLYGAIRLLS